MNRECPKCGKKMQIDSDKYVNATVWVCSSCSEEIFICDNCE